MSKNFSAKDSTGTDIAGGIVNFDSSIAPAVDGSLTPIATDFTASDPTANTAGASTSAYSTPYLLRWIVKGLQAVFSKFSAGVALSDTDANPTTTSVGAKGQLWDGSQWVRARQAVTGSITFLGGLVNTINLARYNATTPTLTDGDHRALQLSGRAELITSEIDLLGALTSITAVDVGTTTVTGQSGQSIVTGAPTAGSFVSIAPTGDSSFSARISGTFAGTLQFERTTDNVSWNPINADVAGTNTSVSQATAFGSFHGNASSCLGVRVRCLTLTSGSPSVQLLTGAGVNTIRVGNPLRLIDPGSSATMTIKAASVLPVATDSAIVVSNRDAIITTCTSSSASVTSTSSAALASNSSRKYAVITNTGSIDVWLHPGLTAVSGQGILLKPNGSFEIDSTNLYPGVVAAVTTSGTTSLAITEGV